MRIKKIEIHDFRGLSDVVIENFDEHLNLLMGVNGAGKSSVLDAIALMLQPYTSRLSTKAGLGIRMTPEDIKKRSRRGCTLQITIDDENNTTWSISRSKSRVVAIESNMKMLSDYTLPLRKALDSRTMVNLPIIAHYGVNRAIKVIARNSVIMRAMMPDKNDDSSDAYSNWFNSGIFYRGLLVWFKEKEAEEYRKRIDISDYRDRDLEAVREAIKIIFPDYSEMRMLNSFQIGLKKEGEEFPLDLLSDGEKCYITLICDIVRRLAIANPTGNVLEGEGIVLIDEVDLHLHPSWETTVMEKLRLVFPNIQFIVSAHSPLVASHFDGQVYGIRNGEVEPLPRLHGLDYSTILLQYMGVRPEHREINSLVEMYRSYTRHNMQEQAQGVWNRLVELMDGDLEAPVLKNLKQQS